MRVLMLLILASVFTRCSNNPENKEPSYDFLKEKRVFQFDYHYNIALSRKDVMPYSMTIVSDSEILARSKSDSWKYTIKEELSSTKSEYIVIANGGNTAMNKDEDYKMSFRDGVLTVKRLSNDASWFYVDSASVIGFEKELDKAGLVFHR